MFAVAFFLKKLESVNVHLENVSLENGAATDRREESWEGETEVEGEGGGDGRWSENTQRVGTGQ